MADETAWLIENGASKVSAPLYYTGGLNGLPDWSLDHMVAMRFGKEDDAIAIRERINLGIDHGHRVCEHGWDATIDERKQTEYDAMHSTRLSR